MLLHLSLPVSVSVVLLFYPFFFSVFFLSSFAGVPSSIAQFDVKNARLVDVLTPTDLRSAAKRAQSRIWHIVTAYGCRTRRRHVVYTMTVSVSREGPPDSSSPPQLLRQGALHVVELAGSERIDKSQVQGKRLKEVQRVNCSLTCVGDVLAALGEFVVFVQRSGYCIRPTTCSVQGEAHPIP